MGVTRRFGRRSGGALQPVVPGNRSDGVLIRVSVSDAPGTVLSVGGDFNDWRSMPMHREGDEWVIRLPITPGVYNFAFRSGNGQWFVPPSILSRRDDGMGGYVGVLVVS